jgi:hypothetical protein
MISFKQQGKSDTFTRFGKLYLDETEYYELPSFAPVPRRDYEIDSMMHLKSKGVKFPIIIAPLRKRKEAKAFIATSVISEDGNTVGVINDKTKTLMLPDTEPEIFSINVVAREEYRKDKLIPKQVKDILLNTNLSENKENNKIEYGEAWDLFNRDYDLSILRSYEERLQSELGSPIFFVPTPLIRANIESVDRAFNYGIQMMVTTEKQSFKGIGLSLLIDSKVFSQTSEAENSRKRLIRMISKIGKQEDIKISSFPFLSFKIYDSGDNLVKGSQASEFRKTLSSTVTSMAEEIRSMNGLLISHNFGRWSLGAIDSGVDIAAFHCNAQVFAIDRFRQGSAPLPNLQALPFDPEKFADGNLNNFKKVWLKLGTFPHPPHVDPVEWWNLSSDSQYRYRARTIIDAHMEFGQEIRNSINSEIPVSESVSSRVSRMAEQDPMFDLCPSLRNE